MSFLFFWSLYKYTLVFVIHCMKIYVIKKGHNWSNTIVLIWKLSDLSCSICTILHFYRDQTEKRQFLSYWSCWEDWFDQIQVKDCLKILLIHIPVHVSLNVSHVNNTQCNLGLKGLFENTCKLVGKLSCAA